MSSAFAVLLLVSLAALVPHILIAIAVLAFFPRGHREVVSEIVFRAWFMAALLTAATCLIADSITPLRIVTANGYGLLQGTWKTKDEPRY